jgi:hypothetical protein
MGRGRNPLLGQALGSHREHNPWTPLNLKGFEVMNRDFMEDVRKTDNPMPI